MLKFPPEITRWVFESVIIMFKTKKPQNKNEISLPVHIGIIMDGNGRWAKKHSLPRMAGHSAGAATFKSITRHCNKIGVKYLTVYAFSTENWKRPKQEVDNIMNILRDYLRDVDNFRHENIMVKFIGDLTVLPQDIVDMIRYAENESQTATGLKLNVALNYGGRNEIVNAVKAVCRDVVKGEVVPDDISEEQFSNYMYTAGIPDPDFIIRPSGEFRLSNFLVWQSAYSEFWFSNVLWPDFKPKHLDRAIEEFSHRNRRFGGV